MGRDVALPDFLIIGAQKAGTTTLYRMLQGHPDVYLPELKEPGFFIRAFPDPVRFQTLRRPDDGRTATPIGNRGGGTFTREEYEALFAPGAARRLRGEASTPYLPSPYAAARIRETIPDARLIVLLRDPVERAYSAYTYNLSRGTEPARSFADAVEDEMRGARNDWIYGWRYLYTGRYAEHLARFLAHFPREQLRVLSFDALRQDAASLYRAACSFLDIAPQATVETDVHNPTAIPASALTRGMKNLLTTNNPLKRLARAAIPAGWRRRVGSGMLATVDRFGVRPPPMDAPTRERLREYYRAPNEELVQLLGHEGDFAAKWQ